MIGIPTLQPVGLVYQEQVFMKGE